MIYVLPPPEAETLAEPFQVSLMGQVAQQDFRAIRLWDLNAVDALALKIPALLPFLPMMKGGANEQILRRCVTRLQQEPNGEELVTILALFAGLVMDKDVVLSDRVVEVANIAEFEQAVAQLRPAATD